jgi:hypothetical protein
MGLHGVLQRYFYLCHAIETDIFLTGDHEVNVCFLIGFGLSSHPENLLGHFRLVYYVPTNPLVGIHINVENVNLQGYK